MRGIDPETRPGRAGPGQAPCARARSTTWPTPNRSSRRCPRRGSGSSRKRHRRRGRRRGGAGEAAGQPAGRRSAAKCRAGRRRARRSAAAVHHPRARSCTAAACGCSWAARSMWSARMCGLGPDRACIPSCSRSGWPGTSTAACTSSTRSWPTSRWRRPALPGHARGGHRHRRAHRPARAGDRGHRGHRRAWLGAGLRGPVVGGAEQGPVHGAASWRRSPCSSCSPSSPWWPRSRSSPT